MYLYLRLMPNGSNNGSSDRFATDAAIVLGTQRLELIEHVLLLVYYYYSTRYKRRRVLAGVAKHLELKRPLGADVVIIS